MQVVFDRIIINSKQKNYKSIETYLINLNNKISGWAITEIEREEKEIIGNP